MRPHFYQFVSFFIRDIGLTLGKGAHWHLRTYVKKFENFDRVEIEIRLHTQSYLRFLRVFIVLSEPVETNIGPTINKCGHCDWHLSRSHHSLLTFPLFLWHACQTCSNEYDIKMSWLRWMENWIFIRVFLTLQESGQFVFRAYVNKFECMLKIETTWFQGLTYQ